MQVFISTFIKTESKPEWDVVCIKHLCNTKQLSSVLLNWVQDDHLQYTQTCVGTFQTSFGGGVVLRTGEQTNQIVEVFPDLPDDPGEGGPEQLLHVVRP